MNKFINSVLLFILFPTMLIAIYVGLDLPLAFLKVSGRNLPYKDELFLGIGLFVLMINVRRSVRRWVGMKIVNKKGKFKWNVPVSKERKKRVSTYLLLEAIVMLFAGGALYVVCKDAWMPAIGFAYVAFDNIIFSIVGIKRNAFRLGLSKKALVVSDRDVILMYFSGLQKVSVQQDSIFFDYAKGLQLSFPADCIPNDRKDEFFDELENLLDRDKVYFSRVRK